MTEGEVPVPEWVEKPMMRTLNRYLHVSTENPTTTTKEIQNAEPLGFIHVSLSKINMSFNAGDPRSTTLLVEYLLLLIRELLAKVLLSMHVVPTAVTWFHVPYFVEQFLI